MSEIDPSSRTEPLTLAKALRRGWLLASSAAVLCAGLAAIATWFLLPNLRYTGHTLDLAGEQASEKTKRPPLSEEEIDDFIKKDPAAQALLAEILELQDRIRVSTPIHPEADGGEKVHRQVLIRELRSKRESLAKRLDQIATGRLLRETNVR